MSQKLMYCKICNKETTHNQAAQGLPWSCQNKHPNDDTCCHNCGVKLDKKTLKLMKAFGASVVICKKCRKN